MKISKPKNLSCVNEFTDTAPSWVVAQKSLTSSPITSTGNSVQIGWPQMSQVIYPGQTGRINTGVTSTMVGTGSALTTYPQKTLLQNGLMSFP
jgi:hypothetical protein